MQAEFYKGFKKHIKSTKQPLNGGDIKNIYLKANTSMEQPIFLIDGIDLDYNYVRVGDHYYFIEDIRLGNNDVYEIICSHDPMATFKDDILSYTGYVLYSGSDYNKWLADGRLDMSNDIITNTTSVFNTGISDGTIIITVAGTDPINNAKLGFTNVYEISLAAANALSAKMYDSTVLGELDKMFKDPYKAIIEAHWVPFPAIGGETNTIFVGSRDLKISAKGLKSQMTQTFSTYTLDIPWINNDWRDLPPFATLQLYLPFYGTVTLDQSKFVGQSTMTVRQIRDAISGEINYTIICGPEIMQYKCDAAVPLAIGQTTGMKPAGVAGTLSGIGTIIGGGLMAATGHGMASAGTLAAGVAALGNGAKTYFTEEGSAKGGNGGFATGNQVLTTSDEDAMRYIRLTMYEHKFGIGNPNNINSIEGRPLFATRRLSTLAGFCQCGGASIPIAGYRADKELINTYVNTGFYIE